MEVYDPVDDDADSSEDMDQNLCPVRDFQQYRKDRRMIKTMMTDGPV